MLRLKTWQNKQQMLEATIYHSANARDTIAIMKEKRKRAPNPRTEQIHSLWQASTGFPLQQI